MQNNFEAQQTEPARTAQVALRTVGMEPGLSAALQRGPERMAQIVMEQGRQMEPGLKPADDCIHRFVRSC